MWFCLLLCGLAMLLPAGAQQTANVRRVVQRTAAPYPALARSMALQGTVKVEALFPAMEL